MWRRFLGWLMPGLAPGGAGATPAPEPWTIPEWPPAAPDAHALRVAAKRGLPKGLVSCPVCGHPRGRSRKGYVSACLCSGVRCLRCGVVVRRPVSDHYDPREHRWSHQPYFALMAHHCDFPPGVVPPPIAESWQKLEPAPEVAEVAAEATAAALRGLDARADARERFARGEDVPPDEMGILYLAPDLELQRSPIDGRPIVVRRSPP